MWTKEFPGKEGWYYIFLDTPQFGCEITVGRLRFEEHLGWRVDMIGSDEVVEEEQFSKRNWQWHSIQTPPMP